MITQKPGRLLLCVGLAVHMMFSMSVMSPAHAAESRDVALNRSVQSTFEAQLLSQKSPSISPGGELVETIKQDVRSGWILGTVTEIVPSGMERLPISKLYLAQRGPNGSWLSAIEGSEAFVAMVAAAPQGFLTEEQTAALDYALPGPQVTGRAVASAAEATGLALPWALNKAWRLTGGPHGWSGQSRPYNSLDLSGGDGRVLASADGVLVKSCVASGSAILKLVHSNGYSTTYYHLERLAALDNGVSVKRGDFLGMIGNALPCGGHTSGAHVHLALGFRGQEVAVDGKNIGGWQFFEADAAYGGYATRGASRVDVGGTLINFGAEGTTEPSPQPPFKATVQPAPGATMVNLRSGPSMTASVIATLQRGATVELMCHVLGDTVQGNWGATRIWDRTQAGQWISDGFVNTGSNEPVVPLCAS